MLSKSKKTTKESISIKSPEISLSSNSSQLSDDDSLPDDENESSIGKDSQSLKSKKTSKQLEDTIDKNLSNKQLLDFENKEKKIFSQNKYPYLYPNLNDPDFNLKIAEKKEFSDNSYNGKIYDLEQQAEKLCNAEFELAPHQLFVRNFLSFNTPYNSLLLFHGLGTGKTCSAIGVCEEMRDYMKQMGLSQRIIIVASPNVQDNFRLQLFDERKLKLTDGIWNIKSCTGNKFLKEINPMNMQGLTKEKIINQIKRIINNYYLFMGYTEFSNYISKKSNIDDSSISDEVKNRIIKKKLKNLFNNRLIVIDEVQNIRISDDNKKKKIAINLMKLVKNVDNLRLLLLSATPMYNSYKEIIWLINLMNTNDKRAEISVNDIFDKNGNFIVNTEGKEIGKELLIQKATGYISFIRGENPYTFPYRIWPSMFDPKNSLQNLKTYPKFQLNNKEIIQSIEHLDIFLTKIGDIQEKGYNLIIKNLINNTKKSELESSGFENMDSFGYTILTNPLEALNIVFPISDLLDDSKDIRIEELIGKNGLRRIMNYTEVKESGKEERYNYEYKSNILSEFGSIFSPNEIGKYSSKISNIISNVQNSNGIILIYSQYLEGGLVPIALALEEIGFTKFGSSNYLLKSNPKTKTGKYIMITGDKFYSPDNNRDIKAVTSENNINGENIKVILISKAGSEGLDFKNIRQVHVLEPWYNTNRIEQIIGRAVRTCSHKLLPFVKRNVEIFLYGTILENKLVEAADLYVYRISEIKAVQIGRVSRVLKQSSVDCILNHEQQNFTESNFNKEINLELSNKQNLLYKIGDKPYSAICDYMESCSYDCIPNKPVGKINLDTYDETFILLNNERIIQRIKNLFKEKYIFKKNSLLSSINIIKEYPLMQIYSALNQLIDDKNEFLIDKYGRTGFLINIGEYYMFQPSEIKSKFISTFDRNKPINFKKNKLIINLNNENKESETSDSSLIKINTSEIIKQLENNYKLVLNLQPITRGETNWYKFCSHVIIKMEKMGINRDLILEFIIEHQFDMLSYTDKVDLINYLYFKKTNYSDYEIKIKKCIDKKIIKNKEISGILLQKQGKQKLLILKDENWSDAQESDYSDLASQIQKLVDNVIENLNDIIGFISNFKDEEMVFKTKDLKIKRSKGARCDQAGKKGNNGVLKTLNKIIGEDKYNEENTKFIYALELCVLEELTLRYYNKINHNKKIWFLGPEQASLLNIENYQK